MKNRVLTGVVYVVVWIILCALKWVVPDGWGSLGFDALFCAISVLGCLELLRVLGDVSYMQKVITIAYCAVAVPLFVAVEIAIGQGMLALACITAIYAMVLAALSVFNHNSSKIKGLVICLFAMLYCGVLSCVLSAVNHVENNSTAAIIALFMIIMFTDAGAFIIGILLGRFVPKKLAPVVSPNKTVIGAVGGLIGGMLGAVAAYFIYYGLGKVLDTPLIYSGSLHPAVVFMLIGLVISVIGQIGDLFESAIKRDCGIKDTGKIFPGHGGVLDRFDSMLFSGVVALLAFAFIVV